MTQSEKKLFPELPLTTVIAILLTVLLALSSVAYRLLRRKPSLQAAQFFATNGKISRRFLSVCNIGSKLNTMFSRAHARPHPKLDHDRFTRFAGITVVTNTNTDRHRHRPHCARHLYQYSATSTACRAGNAA